MNAKMSEFQQKTIKHSPYRIFDNMLEGCQIISPDYEYLYVNDAVATHARLTKEELIGKKMMDVFPGIEDTPLFSTLSRCLKNRASDQMENIFTFPDGSTGYYELRMQPVPEGILIFSLDITKRKRSEEILRNQEQLLRDMGNIAGIGGWEINPETGKGTWTSEAIRIHQIHPDEEMTFGRWLDVYPDDSRKKLEKAVKDAFYFGSSFDMELEIVRPDKTRIWVRTIGRPMVENSRIVKVRGATQDINDRKLAELRIEHLNRVLLTIRNVNQLIVQEKNIEKLIQKGCRLITENRGYQSALVILTDKDGKPESWSESGLGSSFSQLTEMLEQGDLPPCYDFCAPIDQILIIKNRKKVCRRCHLAMAYPEQEVMFAKLTHDNTNYGCLIVSLERSCGDNIEELDLFSEMAGDIAYAVDSIRKNEARRIAEHERNLLERQLIQAQKMESIGTLAGGIAHDFNNILSSIIGFTELTLDDVEKGTIIEKNLQEIFTAGKRAKDLVKQILTFARKSEEAMEPIQVDNIIEEVLKFIRSSIPATIEIRQNINCDALIIGNPTQVHQLLMNLCTNASQAMDENGGILDVNLKNIVFDGSYDSTGGNPGPGEYVEIKVADTGKGIPAEDLKSIFEPYFTTKEKTEGTGLGLAVVHGIVESYGGRIMVKSEPGRGTCFTVLLPVADKHELRQSPESESLPKGVEHILFVDDEEPIVKSGGEILKRLGYTVTAVTDPVRALEIFKTSPGKFDLIITDMTMPNMTGDKLASELLKVRNDIPVILCSGYSKRLSSAAISARGIKAFVNKPLSKADYSKVIREVLDGA